jgi:hypothetical protein
MPSAPVAGLCRIAMLISMALLDTLIRKHGTEEGRKQYNRWHRQYRKRNKQKMLRYWKSRRDAQKTNNDGLSSGL